MRSLVHKKDNSKRNQIILGVFLIIILGFSTIGYALGGRGEKESNEKIEYNGIEFIQDNSGYWYFEIQNNEFITRYTPPETEDIIFFSSLNINDYSNKPLYFAGEIGEGSSEIGRNLINRFVLRIQEACLDEEGCIGDLPVKNCSNDNIISFEQVPENGLETMYQEENCIFIFTDYMNQTRYADKFLFELLGV